MIYSKEESAKRQQERESRALRRSIYRTYAFLPCWCQKCGREFQWEFGWAHYAYVYKTCLCKECAPNKEAAYQFLKEYFKI